MQGMDAFTGIHTYAGRLDDQDSLVSSHAAVQGKVHTLLFFMPMPPLCRRLYPMDNLWHT